MHAKRFKKLIEAVKATPTKLFNMQVWSKRTDCGTVGCAVGSYCHAHRGAALKLKPDELFLTYLSPLTPTLPDGTRSMEAVARHFEISLDDALHLFDPPSYEYDDKHVVRKSVVLKRLRAFYRAHLPTKPRAGRRRKAVAA